MIAAVLLRPQSGPMGTAATRCGNRIGTVIGTGLTGSALSETFVCSGGRPS